VALKKCFIVCSLLVVFPFFLSAQSHLSVPLGEPVYHVIEQAQLRGLCGFLPNVKPYSRDKVLSIIEEILNNNETLKLGRLTEQEQAILEQFRQTYNPNKKGIDLTRGTYSVDHVWHDIYFSGELGFGLDLGFSGAYYAKAGGFQSPARENPENPDKIIFPGANHPDSGDFYNGIDSWIYVSFKGDLGRKASYGLGIQGGFFKSPRAVLGEYNTFYEGYPTVNDDDPARFNQLITTYSEPLTYFPYTYKKNWDGSVWYTSKVDNAGHEEWPEALSIGYSMIPELAGAGLNGHVFYRFARVDREWSGMTSNGSLVLNQSAQPFFAAELTITPFTWISFSGLAGILEHSAIGIKDSARTFQNAFSINMLEVNIKNYFHIDFGSSAVWPKRFELGYLFPLVDKFLYQNNIGDFDNMALFLNLQGQYPGLGKLWFSFFMDEVNTEGGFFEKSRQMYSYQFGGSFHIPLLSFTSVTLSYTKVEPYTYTHTREDVPWYGTLPMETNYVNNGRPLGYYIPPNSDEILVRFDTMPAPRSKVSLQYQLIRHGADYGSRAVGGSSFWSELDPDERSDIKKYFLHDGAYQWMHIFKVGGEYSFSGFKIPVKLFCELGGVYSYFTDIDNSIPANAGIPNMGSRHPYSIINKPEYPHSISFIMFLGVKVFPK
jgi:hypothetical protein